MATFTSIDETFPVANGDQTALAREAVLTDVNGDGRPDLILSYQLFPAEPDPVPIRVLLGEGDGLFTNGGASVFPNGAPSDIYPRGHAVADFNGDGRPDFFFADVGYDADPYPGYRNSLALSSGGVYVDATASLPANSDYTPYATAGDVNGDGSPDLFVGDLGRRGPYFLINDGTGHFTVDTSRLNPTIANPANGLYTTGLLFDANGDGKLDLFLGSNGELIPNTTTVTTSKIVLNDGAGHFETIGSILPAPQTGGKAVIVDAEAADLNGDGRPDLVLDVALGTYSQGTLQLLINNSDGTFSDQTATRILGYTGTLTPPGSWIYRTQIVDVNGDGHPDIVLTTGGGTSPVVLNDGAGNFIRLPNWLPDAGAGDMLTVGDVNGDGRVDVLDWRGNDGSFETLRTYLSAPAGPSQTGDNSANSLLGGSGDDTLSGLGGDDVLAGGAGADSLDAGPGNDTVDGDAGDDTVLGGDGNDFIRGFDGNDSIDGGAGNDDLNGNQGNDVVHGGDGNDFVRGGQGNDTVYGDAGDDSHVNGNLGDDIVHGGDGNDTVYGGQGNDTLYGDAGDDLLSGDLGNDILWGGAGADRFVFRPGGGVDWVMDFKPAEGDRIQLPVGVPYTVTATSDGQVILDLGHGDAIALAGISPGQFSSDWVVFA